MHATDSPEAIADHEARIAALEALLLAPETAPAAVAFAPKSGARRVQDRIIVEPWRPLGQTSVRSINLYRVATASIGKLELQLGVTRRVEIDTPGGVTTATNCTMYFPGYSIAEVQVVADTLLRALGVELLDGEAGGRS